MEVIRVRIPYSRSAEFLIYPFSDAHLGSVHSDEDGAERALNKIVGQDNAYIIGVGDYSDCILKNDPRFDIEGLAPWVEKGNIVESQRRRVVDLFTPVKDKVLCLLTGNHEETIHSHYQDNITLNICRDLGVSYGGYSCFVVLTFERNGSNESHEIIIHSWHGAGAAQTEGARLSRLMRLVNEVQAHIYLMGHLHAMTQHTPDRLVCRNGRVRSIRLAATITGSWLKTYEQPKDGQYLSPSYGELKGYKPSRIGMPVIHIRPDADEMFTIES